MKSFRARCFVAAIFFPSSMVVWEGVTATVRIPPTWCKRGAPRHSTAQDYSRLDYFSRPRFNLNADFSLERTCFTAHRLIAAAPPPRPENARTQHTYTYNSLSFFLRSHTLASSWVLCGSRLSRRWSFPPRPAQKKDARRWGYPTAAHVQKLTATSILPRANLGACSRPTAREPWHSRVRALALVGASMRARAVTRARGVSASCRLSKQRSCSRTIKRPTSKSRCLLARSLLV